MIYQTINEEGEKVEIEAFTKEEMDVVKSEYDIKLSEKDTSFNSLADEKKVLEDKMGGVKEDHPNFKILKEKLDAKDKEISEFKTTYETDKKQSKVDFEDGIIKSVTRGNKELQDKIKYHLENTVSGMKDDTKENHQKKIEAAMKLSSDNVGSEPGIFDSVAVGVSGKGADFKYGGEDSANFTSNEKSLGAKLGNTEEDFKRYASRVTKR